MLLKQHGVTGCIALWVRIEKYRGKIYWKVLYSVHSFIETILLTVLNLSDCALEESLTVLTERNVQTDAAEIRVYVNLNLTT